MPAITKSTPTTLPDTLFSAVIDQAPEAILLTSSSGTIVYANKQGLQLLGYKMHELLGRSIVEINKSVSNGNWAEIVESTANSGSVTRRSMVQAKDVLFECLGRKQMSRCQISLRSRPRSMQLRIR